jgi:hypothetical protein
MATLTALSVPQRSYTAGQSFGPTTFNLQSGAKEMRLTFTNPSGWPTGNIATLTMQISYDNGNTWTELGGLTLNGDAQGVNDEMLGIISGASLSSTFPLPANATSKGRAQAQVLKTFTTAITVTST